jgi:thiosulfate/3-mercaptopyruvate sulfurtransferase
MTMKYLLKSISFIMLVLLASGVHAQFDIISAKEASKMIKNEGVIVVSTRNADDYAKVHIDGAINIEMKSLYKEGSIEGLIKSPGDLTKILGEKGLDPSASIIIYDNGKYVNAGYLYWILDYLGYQDVKILDGHMSGWRNARGPVTKTPYTRPPLVVTPKLKPEIYVDYNYVKGKLNNPGTVLVDVQSPKEFGEGHISGAINMENKNFFDEESSTLKSKEEIGKVLAEHQIGKDKEVILYCASSARAGTVYLAMKALGYSNLKLYEGGYNEWKTK